MEYFRAEFDGLQGGFHLDDKLAEISADMSEESMSSGRMAKLEWVMEHKGEYYIDLR
jgi:hypothetical protein